MIINTKVRMFGKMFLFHFQSMNIPKEATAGICARIPYTTHYAIFLDYDNICDEVLKEDTLTYLQERHRLGDFHVFASNEFGRHVICVDSVPLRKAVRIVSDSGCDPLFAKGISINEYRTWVLRALEKGDRDKPKYLYPVLSPYNGERLQSQAHAHFLELHYGVKVRLVNPDGNEIIEMQGYKTASKVSVAELQKELNKNK